MQNIPIISRTVCGCVAALLCAFITGCGTTDTRSAQQSSSTAKTSATTPTTTSPAPAAPVVASPTLIRIKAGVSEPFKDSNGNVWEAERGFDGGSIIARDGITVANTKDEGLFLSEHYSMDSFSCPLANGKYIAKLYFSEMFEGITGPGQRVFSFNVQGHEFKDFDVWVRAGGPHRAYIESVPVEVNDGKFKITFTSNIENPQINAIEVIPQP